MSTLKAVGQQVTAGAVTTITGKVFDALSPDENVYINSESFLKRATRLILSKVGIPTAYSLTVNLHDQEFDWIRALLINETRTRGHKIQCQQQIQFFDDADEKTCVPASNYLRRFRLTKRLKSSTITRKVPIEIQYKTDDKRYWYQVVFGVALKGPLGSDNDTDFRREFMLHCREAYMSVVGTRAFIWDAKSDSWREYVMRRVTRWSMVTLPKKEKQQLYERVSDFLSDETQTLYKQRGYPHKLSILLHGPGGTGKSTAASAIACEFGLNYYYFNFSDPSLTDNKIMHMMMAVRSGSLILLDDIDSAMEKLNLPHAEMDDPTHLGRVVTAAQSLAAIYGVLDGPLSKESRIIFCITANNLAVIPENVLRPGRVDIKILFDYLDFSEIEHMISTCYWPDGHTNTSISKRELQCMTEYNTACIYFHYGVNVLTTAMVSAVFKKYPKYSDLYVSLPNLQELVLALKWCKKKKGGPTHVISAALVGLYPEVNSPDQDMYRRDAFIETIRERFCDRRITRWLVKKLDYRAERLYYTEYPDEQLLTPDDGEAFTDSMRKRMHWFIDRVIQQIDTLTD